MKRLTHSRLSLAVVLALFATMPSAAYAPYGWKWSTTLVDYYINPANLDVATDVAIASVRAGADAWALQSASPFAFNYVGTTGGTTVANNGRNEVMFRNATNGTAIATTYWWTSGSQPLDADIVFWDGAYAFYGGSTGCVGGFYIQDVATHEFGHALGLGHSSVTDATMVSGQQYCSTYKRSLAPDDVLGIEFLYPVLGSNTPPTVAISSPLTNSVFTLANTITFTGTASDVEDGTLTPALSWSSNLAGPLGVGGTISRTLGAGTHTISASATDANGATRTAAVTVIVNDTSSGTGVVLQAAGYKIRSYPRVDLTWSAAAWPMVDVYRNGIKVTTTSNDRAHTDAPPKGAATYTYKICDAGTATCSNNISVTF